MKITAVKTFVLKHPMSRPSGPSTYYYREREILVIKLETDAGISGWGETVPFTGVRSLIDEQYSRILVGRDPLEHRRLWRELWGRAFGNGMALGGVDIALEDLRGKALGLPVAELYGGRLRDRVPVYVSALNYIEGNEPASHYPSEAAGMVERGFRGIKMRIGGLPFRQDLAAITAVREAVGPDVKLMADGNGAYTLGAAIQMGRELERLGLYWYEEPLNLSDFGAYAVLRDSLDIPIAAFEGLGSRGLFKQAIEQRAMDIVQPDVSLAGGIGECLFVAELARLWGITCMPHCWAGGIVIAATVHLLSLLPDASWARTTETPMLELDMVESPFRDKLTTAPVEIREGFATVPTGPGLGVEVDEERLKFYSVP